MPLCLGNTPKPLTNTLKLGFYYPENGTAALF